MSKKVFGTVLKVIGITALVFATAGAAGVLLAGGSLSIAASVVASQVLLGSIALSVGSGLLAAAKAAKAGASARAEQIRAMVNPQAKANWVFGETADAIQIIYSETAGSNKDKATLVYAGPAHEIESYGQLYINDEAVNFSGNDATGAWAGAVKRYLNLGAEAQTALSIPNSTWPSTARGRGFAHFALQWSLDHNKVSESGVIPDRITQVVEGCLCYDPRLDTTVGGSGSHRADDQTTWEYSANWALIVLHYILGWRNNSILVYGRGADPLDIDYASFISAANVCDATVDGIPRYHIGGIERIDGDHARVIASLEATIGGKIAKIGGKYFCWAPFDDLVSLETISENDLIREVGVNYQADRSIENIYSVGQGQFIDPSVLYLPAPYPEVSDTDAVTAMGRRIMRYDTPFLQVESRVERVVLQQIRRSLFGQIWQIGVGPKFFRRNVFDILTLNIKETNNTDVLVRITNKVMSPSGLIILTLEEENSLIYDVTAALGTPFSRNLPPTFDHATKIPVVNLALNAVTVTGSAGTASDAIQVSYDDPGPLVSRTDIEIRVNSTTDWQPASSKRLDAGVAIIVPVESGTLYDVRVRHWTVFFVASDFVSDTITAGLSQIVRDVSVSFDKDDFVDLTKWTFSLGLSGVVSGGIVTITQGNAQEGITEFSTTVAQNKRHTITIKMLDDQGEAGVVVRGVYIRRFGADYQSVGATTSNSAALSHNVNWRFELFEDNTIDFYAGGVLIFQGLIAITPDNKVKLQSEGIIGQDARFSDLKLFSSAVNNFGPDSAASQLYADDTLVEDLKPSVKDADVTADNTAADTDLVAGTSATTVKNGAVRANLGLNSSGELAQDILSARLDSSNALRRTTGGLFTGDLAAKVGAIWDSTVSNRPTELTDGRVSAGFNSDGDLFRDLHPGILADQGDGVGRRLMIGLETSDARDGDAISFVTPYNDIPVVQWFPSGITTSTALTGDVAVSFDAIDVSTTGFTASILLKELAATIVSHTDTVGEVPGTGGQPDRVMEKQNTTPNAAWDDRYTFQFDVTVRNLLIETNPDIYSAGTATIGIYIKTTGAGSFVRFGSKVVNGSGGANLNTTVNNVIKTITVSGVVDFSGVQFGVNLESSSPAGSVVFNLDSVKYETATPPAESVASPAGASPSRFMVVQ